MSELLTHQTDEFVSPAGAATGGATTKRPEALAFYSFARYVHATNLTLKAYVEAARPALEESDFADAGVKSAPASWREL